MSAMLTTKVWNVLTAAISKADGPIHSAVAYLGKGGSTLLPLPPKSALAVDASAETVASGSTCPSDLLALQANGVRIFSLPRLHAKVYCLKKEAFIGSANVSNNSANHLVEALIRTTDPTDVAGARAFVESVCQKELTKKDLERLSLIYRPPRKVSASTLRKLNATLIMELTSEQGAGRERQVQPPLGVWRNYFGVDIDGPSLPTFTLVDIAKSGTPEEVRPVVKHHHNYTIEIAGAGLPRPAIIKMRRLSPTKFGYQVFRNGNKEFGHLDWVLDSVKNPYQSSGRRWMVI